MKKKRYLILGLVISVIFLFFAVKDLNFQQLTQALLNANLYWLFPMVAAAALFFWIKALRWQLLLVPVSTTTIKELFPSMMIGVAFNYILFGYLGELVRTYLLCRERHLRKSSVLATIVLERIFDLLTILVFLGFGLLLSSHNPPEIRKIGYIALTLGFFSLLIVTVIVIWSDTCLTLCHRLTKRLPNQFAEKLATQVELGILGLKSISQTKLLLGIIITSIGQWIFMGLCNWFAMIAMGIDVPYYAVFTTIALISFGMTLPSSPGQIGIVELCYIISLKSYGVGADKAFAAAILYHFLLYFGVILTGALISRNLGYTLRQVRQRAELVTKEE